MKQNSQEVKETEVTEEENKTPETASTQKNEEPAQEAEAEKNEDKAADEMLNMKKTVEKKEEEVAQLKDLLMRRQADFENYKKQSARQSEMNRRILIKDIAVDIIGINDNLIRASEAAVHVPDGENLEDAHKSYVEGVMMISKSIQEMLGKYGIEEIDAMNQHFDPNVHEAVEIDMSDEVSEDTVTKVFQKGFKLDDFILRSSRVCVTRPLPKAEAPKEEQNTEDAKTGEAEVSEKTEEVNK